MKRSVMEENLNLKINETVLRSAVNYAKLALSGNDRRDEMDG